MFSAWTASKLLTKRAIKFVYKREREREREREHMAYGSKDSN